MQNQIANSELQFAAEWNFLKDGGAVGSIPTGIFLPAGKLMFMYCIQSVVTCVGAGSSFNFGVQGNTSIYGQYSSLAYGNSLTSLIHPITTAQELLITISGAPVTAGLLRIRWSLIIFAGK